jgi:xylulokinase
MTGSGEFIIAYDLGTGGNKASLFDADGTNRASVFVPYQTFYPGSGLHEQRPEDWWDAVVESTKQLIAESGSEPKQITCVSISGHSLGAVPLDEKGNVLRETTPIWSDTRPGEQTDRFFKNVDETAWYKTTGNGFPPECYTLFKVMWYLDNEPEMFDRVHTILGTKDYINFRLTGAQATDFSYASGLGAYDLTAWSYKPEYFEAAGIDAGLFPEIVPSTEIIGSLLPDAADVLGLSKETKVVCGGVDNSCMALGARAIKEGRVYTSLGSSSWIAVASHSPVIDSEKRPFVFTHVVPDMFASAVSIFSAGSSFAWVRDVMCRDLIEQAERQKRDVWELMTEEAARSRPGAKDLLFNPSLAGGSSQEASPHIRGAFSGIDLGHTRADCIRASMEGIAMNLGSVLRVLREVCELEPDMLLVGGGSKSALWRQIFADVFEMAVIKTNVGQDAGSLGAAAVGAVGCGLWNDFSKIDQVHRIENREKPVLKNMQVYRRLREGFELQRRQQAELGEFLRIS